MPHYMHAAGNMYIVKYLECQLQKLEKYYNFFICNCVQSFYANQSRREQMTRAQLLMSQILLENRIKHAMSMSTRTAAKLAQRAFVREQKQGISQRLPHNRRSWTRAARSKNLG